MKTGGGNAGHNGLRSITAHCGNDYARVRLGIGHPGDKALVTHFVLNDFAKAEQPWVEAVCDGCAELAELLVQRKVDEFQSRLHLLLEARGIDPVAPHKS